MLKQKGYLAHTDGDKASILTLVSHWGSKERKFVAPTYGDEARKALVAHPDNDLIKKNVVPLLNAVGKEDWEKIAPSNRCIVC